MALKLQRSLKAFDTPAFEAVLEDELVEKVDQLPLDDVIDSGGYPDWDSVEVVVNNITSDEHYIYAEITVYVQENVPSSCADFVHHEQHQGDLKLSIDRETAEAQADVEGHRCITRNPNDEDDADDDDKPDYDAPDSSPIDPHSSPF